MDEENKVINGGYYIKSRNIQNSEIAHAPPHVREIWDYLLMMANHADNHICNRGQHLTTIDKIREALHWYCGWRKETYKKSACENSMKWLKKAGMVTTRRTTRGSVITIVNYSLYQDPANYESRKVNSTKDAGKPDSCRTINKKNKNIRIKENIKLVPLEKVMKAWDRTFSKEIEEGKVQAAPFFLPPGKISNDFMISVGFLTKLEDWEQLFLKAKSDTWAMKKDWFNFLRFMQYDNILKTQQKTIHEKPQEAVKIRFHAIFGALSSGAQKIADISDKLGLTDQEKDFIRDQGGLTSLGRLDEFKVKQLINNWSNT